MENDFCRLEPGAVDSRSGRLARMAVQGYKGGAK
jgi:hypothetical protein